MLSSQLALSFNVSRALESHIEQRDALEDYINSKSKKLPDAGLSNCNPDCPFAKWLHNHGCDGFKDIKLLNQICHSCEEFQSTAS